MADNQGVNIQHKPFRVLRDLDHHHPDLKSKGASSSATDALSYEEIIGLSTANNIQQDTRPEKLPLSTIVRQLRSSDRHVVLHAIEELRARGCLSDGTLSWKCLRYANLQESNLSAANLMNADFHKANLEMADLSYANLNGARFTRTRLRLANLDKASFDGASLVGVDLQGVKNLCDEQLAQASRMRGSILPDGKLYDGRFNLPGDFADASILRVNLSDPAAIAAFYGVSLDEFLHGQEWCRSHMPSLSVWHKSVRFQNAELIMNEL